MTNSTPHRGDVIDQRLFRTVLGHFPTGVVVVTAIGRQGDPVGMVVGSFTSVSLEPPLVAFLPSRTSASYERLRESDSFCVNVLSENQEELCRRFANRDPDKFNGAAWTPSSGGNPILAGAVAWIDCLHEARYDAGDHDIVVGRVTALGADAPAGPLLFFQGGYGRFDAGSLVAPFSQDLRSQLQVADASRSHLEQLAARTGLEAYAQAVVADDLVIVAAAGSPGRSVRTHIGRRLPLRRPYGATFPAFDHELQPMWSPVSDGSSGDPRRSSAEIGLDRVRRRGWSIGLVAPHHDEYWSTISQHGEEAASPPTEDFIASALDSIAGAYDPPDDELRAEELDVRIISAPVRGPSGDVVESIALFGFPLRADPATVREWIVQVVSSADEISAELSAAG